MTTTYDPKLHKIVPFELTQEMMKSSRNFEFTPNGKVPFWFSQAVQQRWDAMLSAAPEITLNQWQDISTAPKDGTRIMAYVPKKYSRKGKYHPEWKGAIVLARWYVPDAEQINTHKFLLACQHGGYWTAHHKGTQPLKYCPTHWMSLPTPPEN